MDPADERSHSKRQKEYFDMLQYTCDSEYGIPRRCSCGGRIIDEVRAKEEYDTLPGKRFFTCVNYEVMWVSTSWFCFYIVYISWKTTSDICFVPNKADGFHYRQPWVFGVQEQMERLLKRLEEAEEVMKWVPSLKNNIQTLEVSKWVCISSLILLQFL